MTSTWLWLLNHGLLLSIVIKILKLTWVILCNQLDTSCLHTDYSLLQLPLTILTLSIRCFWTNQISTRLIVSKASSKTKHIAVLIVPVDATSQKNKRTTVSVYDLRSHNIDRLRYAIGNFDWSSVLLRYDVTTVYNTFLSIVNHLIALCIPTRNVKKLAKGTHRTWPHWLKACWVKEES